MSDFAREYFADMRTQLAKLRRTAEQAMAQIGNEAFAMPLDSDSNSIAIVVKHVAGNLRSRCTDFLTSDGEKPDRNRDDEFVLNPRDTRESLMRAWAAGWDLLDGTIGALAPDDVQRTIHIRGEPLTVGQALNRHLGHLAYHVGQIVLLAKHWVGSDWHTLSIARGQSQAFAQAMQARHPTAG